MRLGGWARAALPLAPPLTLIPPEAEEYISIISSFLQRLNKDFLNKAFLNENKKLKKQINAEIVQNKY